MKKPTYEKLKKRVKILEKENTELRKAEEAFQESEERFRDLLENANDLIQSVDIEGKFLYVNRKWLEILEYTRDEVGRLTLWDILQEDQMPHCAELFKKVCSGGNIDWIEIIFVSKSGKEVYVEGSTSAKFKDNKFVSTRGIFRDVTEHKKAEQEKEKLLHELNERIKEPNGLYDLGKLTEQVEDLEELFNRLIKDIVSQSMQLPDKVFSKIELDGKKYLSFGKEDLCEDYNCLSVPIIIREEKRGKLCVGYKEDLHFIEKFEQNLINAYAERLGKIIERREAEKALRESEERFRLLFENASDGILIADAETKKFISANKRICEITGYSLDEILKFSVGDIHPKKDLPRVIEEFEKQVRGGIELAKDIPVLRKDETVIYADINSKPIVLDGKSCLVGIFRDTTERKKLEEEKSKRDKIEAINNMIVTINHEMNQSLSVITSYSNYIMDNIEKDSQTYKDSKLINEEAWKMAKLVKKIGKLKEIKTTEYSKGVQMVDLNDID